MTLPGPPPSQWPTKPRAGETAVLSAVSRDGHPDSSTTAPGAAGQMLGFPRVARKQRQAWWRRTGQERRGPGWPLLLGPRSDPRGGGGGLCPARDRGCSLGQRKGHATVGTAPTRPVVPVSPRNSTPAVTAHYLPLQDNQTSRVKHKEQLLRASKMGDGWLQEGTEEGLGGRGKLFYALLW